MDSASAANWLIEQGWRRLRAEDLDNEESLTWWLHSGSDAVIILHRQREDAWQIYVEIDTTNQIEPTLDAVQQLTTARAC